jgi:hypothetical protein
MDLCDEFDRCLVLRPPETILEPLQMSIHTHQVKLSNMSIHYEALFNKLAPALDDAKNVFALHCNHGHAVKLSWQHDESLWKKIPTELELSQKNRKVSGDGSCFQACVEVYVRIKHPEIDPLKIYKIKVFSSTGSIQTPGGRLNSNEDVTIAVNHLIEFLNANDVGRDEDGNSAPVEWRVQDTAMKNYRSRLALDDPQLDLFNYRLSWYAKRIEEGKLDELEGQYIEPPFTITSTVNPDEGSKTSFCFLVKDGLETEDGKPDMFRVEVFNNEKKEKIGKINFKGVKDYEYALKAYKWLEDIFRANWNVFVGPRPRVDASSKKPRGRKNLLESIADLSSKKEKRDAKASKPLARRKAKPRAAPVPKTKLKEPKNATKAPAKAVMRAVQHTPKLEAAAAPSPPDAFDLDQIPVDATSADQARDADLEALLRELAVDDDSGFMGF